MQYAPGGPLIDTLVETALPVRLVLRRRGFFFLDIFVDHARHAAAAKAARWLMFGFAFRIAHESAVKGFLGADEVIVVKR